MRLSQALYPRDHFQSCLSKCCLKATFPAFLVRLKDAMLLIERIYWYESVIILNDHSTWESVQL